MGVGDAGGEHERLPLGVAAVRGRDLVVRLGGVERLVQIAQAEVLLAGRGVAARLDLARIVVHRHLAAVDVGQVPLVDAPLDVAGEHDSLVHVRQAHLVAAVRRGRKAQVQARLEMVVDLAIGRRHRMVRLVGDDEVEIVRSEAVEPMDERGNRGGHHLLARARPLRHLDAYRNVVIGLRLLEDLLAVRQHEHPPAPREPRERDRLAQPGGHLHEVGARRKRVARVDALLLVIAQLQRRAVLRRDLLPPSDRLFRRV